MKVLIVLTSHSDLSNTREKTGFWIEEWMKKKKEEFKALPED